MYKDLKIRPYKDEDANAVLSFIFQNFVEYNAILDIEGYDKDVVDIPNAYRNGHFWILEKAGKAIGSIAVLPEKDGASIHRLYLDPAERGHKYGTLLLRRAMVWAKAAKKSPLWLWTDVRFKHAHRLYEDNGFIRTESRICDDIERSREFKYERYGL